MPSLADFFQPDSSNAFKQADLSLERGGLRTGHALKKSLVERQLRTRTLPDLANHYASNNAFFSSANQKAQARATEDSQQEIAQSEFDLQSRLAQLIRDRYLTSLGVQV